MTTNEAAERLLAVIMERRRLQANEQTAVRNSMRAYERDVRRATVERIRERLAAQTLGATYDVGWVQHILDEEAAR